MEQNPAHMELPIGTRELIIFLKSLSVMILYFLAVTDLMWREKCLVKSFLKLLMLLQVADQLCGENKQLIM